MGMHVCDLCVWKILIISLILKFRFSRTIEQFYPKSVGPSLTLKGSNFLFFLFFSDSFLEISLDFKLIYRGIFILDASNSSQVTTIFIGSIHK